jgi:hypothetical protein
MESTTNYTTSFINRVIGAQSITKTVVGYYDLLDDSNEDDITLLFESMTQICNEEGIPNAGLNSLNQIFGRLREFRNNRAAVSQTHYEETSELCDQYIQWVFTTFPCFQTGENGQVHYSS